MIVVLAMKETEIQANEPGETKKGGRGKGGGAEKAEGVYAREKGKIARGPVASVSSRATSRVGYVVYYRWEWDGMGAIGTGQEVVVVGSREKGERHVVLFGRERGRRPARSTSEFERRGSPEDQFCSKGTQD